MRWCWVNFQCQGVLLIWIVVGQGPIAPAVGADGGCLDIFSRVYHISFPSLSLWETARYRLKYCLKGPLCPKQPTNQSFVFLKNWFLLDWWFLEWFLFEIFSLSAPLGVVGWCDGAG